MQLLARAHGSQPEVVRFCFGTIQGTDVLDARQTYHFDRNLTIRFHTSLDPWVLKIRSKLHLPPPSFIAPVRYLYQSQVATPFWPGMKGSLLAFVGKYSRYPVNGRDWYPGGFPANIRWKHVIVIDDD
jgi:hypothetical protein